MIFSMNRGLHWLVLVLAISLPVGAVYAADPPKAPPPLPDTVMDALQGHEPRLLGYGRMRKWFWDAFDASLWITGDTWSWNEPFVLELRYVRNFDGSEIVEGTRNQWDHLGYTNGLKLNAWLAQLAGIFPSVKAGDQLAGVYLPGAETIFFHNGRPIGAMPDPEFGPTFFSIWLDEKTSQPTLREALLGNHCTKPATVARAEVMPCGGATMPGPKTQRPGADQS